jgi:hypothetical protein
VFSKDQSCLMWILQGSKTPDAEWTSGGYMQLSAIVFSTDRYTVPVMVERMRFRILGYGTVSNSERLVTLEIIRRTRLNSPLHPHSTMTAACHHADQIMS